MVNRWRSEKFIAVIKSNLPPLISNLHRSIIDDPRTTAPGWFSNLLQPVTSWTPRHRGFPDDALAPESKLAWPGA